MFGKNKVWKITVLLVVLGLVLTGQVWGQTRFGPRTEPFFRIFESGTFHIKFSVTAGGVTADVELFVKGEMMAMSTSAAGESIRIIIRDDKTYMINDAEKIIIITAAMPGMSDFAKMGQTDNITFTGTGTAAFNGRNLSYEEYTTNDGRAQYFVDGNKLVGIRSISPGTGTVDSIISVLDQNVPDSAFAVPSRGYQVQDMSQFSY